MKPAVRISFGIVALSTSLLLAADLVLGLFPDPNASILEARQDLSQSLAVQYSALVTADRLPQMKPAMDGLVAQIPDVLSLCLRTIDGEELAGTSEHASLWKRTSDTRSTPTHVRVPILRGAERWGTLEVRFEKLPSAGLIGLLQTPLYQLIAIMGAAGFFAYLFYLSRTLRHLDPSSVVPERVRAALEQLVEGIFILDQNQCIVLANSAFADNFDRSPDSLMGANPASFDWVNSDPESPLDELPWITAMRDGSRRTAVRLELRSPTRGIRVFNCNVSPINDGGKQLRGALASLNDISEVERMNAGLQQALEKLEMAHAEVHDKNEELAVLATIDPLTGCLNRRAFFAKLESESRVAKRDNLQLSVVMADIDFFKSINDDFGHAVGDAVIKDMANELKASLRANDCVGRYGGEEFCILLVGADAEAAERVSNRARLAFEARSTKSDGPTGGRTVTASFGVSALSFGAADAVILLDQADKALYRSKNQGRNQVTSWIDLEDEQRAAS